jgi:hypothetical protein
LTSIALRLGDAETQGDRGQPEVKQAEEIGECQQCHERMLVIAQMHERPVKRCAERCAARRPSPLEPRASPAEYEPAAPPSVVSAHSQWCVRRHPSIS